MDEQNDPIVYWRYDLRELPNKNRERIKPNKRNRSLRPEHLDDRLPLFGQRGTFPHVPVLDPSEHLPDVGVIPVVVVPVQRAL